MSILQVRYILRVSTSPPSSKSKGKFIKYGTNTPIYATVSTAKDVNDIALFDNTAPNDRKQRRLPAAIYKQTYVTVVFTRESMTVDNSFIVSREAARILGLLAQAVAFFKGKEWGRTVVAPSEWLIALNTEYTSFRFAARDATIPDATERVVEISGALRQALNVLMDNYQTEGITVRFKANKGPKERKAREVSGLTMTMQRLLRKGPEALYIDARKKRGSSDIYFTVLSSENKAIAKSKKLFLIYSDTLGGSAQPLVITAPDSDAGKYISLLKNQGANRSIQDGYQVDEDQGIPRIDNAVYRTSASSATSAQRIVAEIVSNEN